jgi:signal peptidase I
MKKIILPIFILLAVILFYTLRIYKITGTSMNYGLIEGDMVLTYRQFDAIKRGDMLVIKHPLDPEDRLYIKRCAALPGDRFFQKERSFYLQIEANSTKTKQLALSYDLQAVSTRYGYFIKDPYLKYYGIVHNWRLQVPKELTKLPLTTVSPGHYLMLGDFRDNSADSRFFGAVPRNWIFSKVIYVFKKPKDWITLINIEEAEKE